MNSLNRTCKNAKKIIIVVKDLEAGGAETQALLLAKGLQAKGYTVQILAFGQLKGLAWERFTKADIPVLFTGFREKLLLPPIRGTSNRLRYLRYLTKLILMLRRMNPDVILPFTYPPNIIMGRYWRLTGAKVCWWNQRDGGMIFSGRPWEIACLHNCSGIISNSMEGRNFLRKFTHKSVTIIHNGVEIPSKNSIAPDSNKIRVVMVANLHGYKDHMTLLKAWKSVVDEAEGESTELILAGKEGDTAAGIRTFISSQKMESTVTCTGLVADVEGLLGECHIGVFSSVTEGLPNGILECMAAALPVVATRITGAEEALGVDYPWLSPAEDAQTMAGFLLHFIRNADERKYWGRKNRERAEKLFAPERMISSYEVLF